VRGPQPELLVWLSFYIKAFSLPLNTQQVGFVLGPAKKGGALACSTSMEAWVGRNEPAFGGTETV